MRLQRTRQHQASRTAATMGDACPDFAGIQFELVKEVRLLELLLGVALPAKTAYSIR